MMKNVRILISILFTLLLASSELNAQSSEAYLLSGGFSRNGFMGSGEAGNEFDFGNGYCVEFGVKNDNFCWILYGISGNTNENHVKNSVAKTTSFTPYYTEFRFYAFDNFLFFFFGFDWNRMHFENAKGSDNQYLCTCGLGGHIPIVGRIFIQPKVKPYLILGNSLDQKWGIAMQLNVGLSLGKD